MALSDTDKEWFKNAATAIFADELDKALVKAATTIKVGNPLDPKRSPWTLDTMLRKLYVGTRPKP